MEEALDDLPLSPLLVLGNPCESLLEAIDFDGLASGTALVLAFGIEGFGQSVFESTDTGLKVRIECGSFEFAGLSAHFLAQLVDHLDHLTNHIARHFEGVDHHIFGQLVGGAFHHGQAVVVPGDNQVQLAAIATIVI